MIHKIAYIVFCLSTILFLGVVNAQQVDSTAVALSISDLSFEASEVDSLQSNLKFQKKSYRQIRSMEIPNDLPYSMVFTPPTNNSVLLEKQIEINWGLDLEVKMPKDKSKLAFFSVHQLANLIKSNKITSVELTQLFLDRLEKYGDTLSCVITITDSLALAQAKRADEELKNGIYRGLLHGIPYGAKDLLAVVDYPTTWGAMPYKDQVLDYNATVITKLEEAGAVLVVKLTLGALAWGDVWFGGKTKNPWNLKEGSSGSSAGPASATAAGLVPFAIGSETWGSITSPSNRCGLTGLRPTFGRVSKHGAMALSWSMDKLGPMCRNAIDCAIVFDAIRGEDGLDYSVRDAPFNYSVDTKTERLRIGVLASDLKSESNNYDNDSATLKLLEASGIELIEKQLPSEIPIEALSIILSVEAGAAFDELTRSNEDSLLVRQIKQAWPNEFRASRLIPAVEYIQANRLRHKLALQFNEMMSDIDVLIAPSLGTQNLITNLTGHPCVILPNGKYGTARSGTITLIGNHFDEASILLLARYIQEQTSFEERIPQFFVK
jgi:Asp-tRNA(Asn)/Glu-tRNA(Gln) amidotransferase A subunit family amidase